MQHPDATAEQVLARLAFNAHGLVKRRLLLRAGISPQQIRSRLRSGALIVEYRGVYLVGHRAPKLEATYLAAVWACGDEAFLCGRAAGHLLGLVKGPAPPPEVMAPTKRRVPAVHTRRYGVLDPDDTMTWRRIPVTSFARTLVDLAAALTVNELARACHEAGVRYRTTPAHVEAILTRRANAPGAAKLRDVLRGDARVSLSKLERRFLAFLREEGLPLPETNRRVDGYRVDCRWPAHKLTAELDSYRYHNSRRAWEADRQREREARKRGDRYRRFTWGDIFEDQTYMRAELHHLLSDGI